MKVICTLFFISFGGLAFCQDVIKCHTGKNLQVEVTEVGENSIYYKFPGESVTQSIGKAAVSEIEFKSGRVQEISEKIDVGGKDGWQNVIITSNNSDVVGLRRVGEIKAKAGGYGSLRTTKGSDKKATERIKREAAEKNGHVVLIHQHETTGRGFNKNPESIQSGVAYGY
ncbi:hypothetical protein [Dyadobacter aurulentus]|uniref:hypothetical protein n=1 Tax=Dyadobacter sp. UC 10 TaxID=2605428 RepID=UPI0011F3E24E|nr:hypothetical protein [Dyadobacter sp. UC 10]KAA0992761.1 hypothetical protein FXO21_22580 [Dyadobacter sp. UC 10]